MSGRECPKCRRELPEATLRALERGTPCPFCATPLKRSPRRAPASAPAPAPSDDGYAAFQVSQTQAPPVTAQPPDEDSYGWFQVKVSADGARPPPAPAPPAPAPPAPAPRTASPSPPPPRSPFPSPPAERRPAPTIVGTTAAGTTASQVGTTAPIVGTTASIVGTTASQVEKRPAPAIARPAAPPVEKRPEPAPVPPAPRVTVPAPRITFTAAPPSTVAAPPSTVAAPPSTVAAPPSTVAAAAPMAAVSASTPAPPRQAAAMAMAMTAVLPSSGPALSFAPQGMGFSLRPGRNLVVAGASAVLTLVAAVVLLHRSPAHRPASLGTVAAPVPKPQAGPAGPASLAAPPETSRGAPVIEPVVHDTVPPPRAAQAERVAPTSAAPASAAPAAAAQRGKKRVAAAHRATAHQRRYAKREKRIARQTQVAVHAARTPAAAGDPRATYERGNALLFSGDAAGAVAAYREAVQLAPTDPIGYRGLGLAYEQLGQTAAAGRALRRYLKLAPGAADRAIISRRIERLGQTASHK